MTKARIFPSPIDAPEAEIEILEPTRLVELFPDLDTMDWFRDTGTIVLNGEIVPPALWQHVTVKPHGNLTVDFITVPRGKKTFLLLATVALVALTTAISGGLLGPASGSIGLGILGSSFAAGGIGANLLAAGVGLAGSLAISALSAPPKVANNGGDQRTLSQAGVTGNPVTALDTLPVIFGKVGYSAPHLVPPYTFWDGDTLTAYAMVGVQGPCLVENVKLNGLPVADIAGASYEVRYGFNTNPRTMHLKTVIEERDGISLSNFQTELASTKNDLLTDQTTPDNSAPKWHTFRTAGTWDEAVLRFLFPSGLVRTDGGDQAFVPIRIEIRKVGDVAWRRLPTFHASDVQKGSGPFRFEIRIERRNPTSGCHFSSAFGEYPVFEVNNYAAIQESFAYPADSYFAPVTMDNTFFYWKKFELALFTSATNANGYTWSASSNVAGGDPWRVHDGYTNGSFWRPNDNTLGTAYIQLACPSPQTFRSYFISTNSSPTTAPTKWRVYGSNDGVNFTPLDDDFIDITEDPQDTGDYQIGSPGAYSYYRWVFHANNGASNQQLRIERLVPSYYDSFGCVYSESGTQRGYIASHGYGYYSNKCRYVSLDKRGARVFLRPDLWDAGEYEIRVMRGVAGQYSYFDSMRDSSGDSAPNYDYNGNGGNWVNYFGYFNSNGYKIQIGQKNYRSDCTIEAFQTISNDSPLDDTGIALVAVALPNAQISSIYAEYTRYGRSYDGTSWSDTLVPTRNPAAMYRDLLLGAANAKPVPGECLDDDALGAWYLTCAAQGYQANAVMQGARVDDAKQMLATCGYAAPRDADCYGVIEDKDTSSDPVRYLITPNNSRDEGTTQELPDIPDAIRAEFSDETQSYAVEHVIIYRDGVTAATAKTFETFNYQGFTHSAKVTARAEFDLKQAQLRQIRYHRRVGFDGLMLERGMLVGLACDVVDGDRAAGFITEITTDIDGKVVSIKLDNIMPWSSSTDFESVEDISTLTDVMNPSQPMGVAIRIPNAPALIKQVSDVSDSNVCTFTTPFPLAGSGLAIGQLTAAGPFGSEVRRCKIMAILPKGYAERQLVLADEAPGLFS